jgi:hypothetical protein
MWIEKPAGVTILTEWGRNGQGMDPEYSHQVYEGDWNR